MTTDFRRRQVELCDRFGVPCQPTVGKSVVGVARNLRSGAEPLNGLRHRATAESSGWYLWAGETLSDDPGFFVPLHADHLGEWRPELLPYLGLPEGSRFVIGLGTRTCGQIPRC